MREIEKRNMSEKKEMINERIIRKLNDKTKE